MEHRDPKQGTGITVTQKYVGYYKRDYCSHIYLFIHEFCFSKAFTGVVSSGISDSYVWFPIKGAVYPQVN
ncbi:MAG: hypothetical protein WCD89_04435 [Anaerocolumna sp.]